MNIGAHSVIKPKNKHKYFWPKDNSSVVIDRKASYYITHPVELAKDIKRTIKYSRQRIKYGFAIYDTWNIDIWIYSTLPCMLRDLAYNTNSIPSGMSVNEWKSLLCRAALLIEQMDDDKCIFKNKYQKEYNKITSKPNSIHTKEEKNLIKSYFDEEARKADYKQKCIEDGLAIVAKNISDLWD